MSEDDLLKKAQNAARIGDRKAAATLFAQQVQEDPNSEEAWLGLGLALADNDKRIFCLKKVLALNPENEAARQALDWLQTPPPSTPTPTPAFVPGEEPTPKEPIAPPAVPVGVTPVQLAKPDESPSQAEKVEKTPPQAGPKESLPPIPKPSTKKRSRGLVWFFVILIIIVLALTGLFLAYATGMLDRFLPESLRVEALSQPTTLPTLTSPALPVVLPTVTPRATPTATPVSLIVYTPVFEAGDCPFDEPGEGEIICGKVLLPENRTDPDTEFIQLAVVEYKATGPSPAEEPVIFLQGGPGAGAVELSAEAYSILVEPFLDRYNFITFDQRGTGLSLPDLECVQLTEVYSQILRGLIPVDSRDLVVLNAFRDCHDLLTISDVDLTAYTTADNAADVKDVLQAMGYSRVNLYGASYGTRLGQQVMRDYPEIVRSAVLDSMLPLETNVYASSAQTAEFALGTLFDSCAADPTCAQAYPKLEENFWTLVDSMNTAPLEIPVVVPYAGGRSSVTVDGQTYLNQVMASLKQTWLIPGIPLSIEQVLGGDTSSLSYTLGFPPIDWDLDISLGMYISIMCHEYIMDSDAETLSAGLEGEFNNGELGWFPFVGDGEDFTNQCEAWDAVPPFEGEDASVTNDIPTLVIEGKFDSITPTTFGQLVAGHLPQSTYLEFPDQGHTPTAASNTDCPMETVLSFFDHPEAGPDSSCLSEEEGPDFLVPYTGEVPIPLVTATLEESAISVDIPEEWFDYGSGTYIRASSGLDITQLTVLRLNATPAQALSILSERTFYGRLMLDSEPIPGAKQILGEFNWSFYTTTSFGTPVDMALANDRGTTLLVLLFTHTNERDALHEAVFLPVVTSVHSTE